MPRAVDQDGRFYSKNTAGEAVLALPLVVALLIAIHFWRVRKDGGISGPL